MPSNLEVAEWMLSEIDYKYSYQEYIAHEMRKNFGDEFVYFTVSGNLAINKKVLAEFKKISKNVVVWELGVKAWRKLKPGETK